jgi:hypothetical protein
MSHDSLCFVEAFPNFSRQKAVHPLVSRSVLAGPQLLYTISIGNSVWEVHTNSGNYADENLPPTVQEHDCTRHHAIIGLYQEREGHTGRERTPSYAVAGVGDEAFESGYMSRHSRKTMAYYHKQSLCIALRLTRLLRLQKWLGRVPGIRRKLKSKSRRAYIVGAADLRERFHLV